MLNLQEKGIKRFDSADWAMGQEKAPGAPKLSLLQRTLQAEAASAAAKPPPAAGGDAMAQQESIAKSKYGALAPKNHAAIARRNHGMKRFDSADWMMSKGEDGSVAPKSLMTRTMESEAAAQPVCTRPRVSPPHAATVVCQTLTLTLNR